MECPECGKSFYPSDWFYDHKTGIWTCDRCGWRGIEAWVKCSKCGHATKTLVEIPRGDER